MLNSGDPLLLKQSIWEAYPLWTEGEYVPPSSPQWADLNNWLHNYGYPVHMYLYYMVVEVFRWNTAKLTYRNLICSVKTRSEFIDWVDRSRKLFPKLARNERKRYAENLRYGADPRDLILRDHYGFSCYQRLEGALEHRDTLGDFLHFKGFETFCSVVGYPLCFGDYELDPLLLEEDIYVRVKLSSAVRL
jgi:hypothetical protein